MDLTKSIIKKLEHNGMVVALTAIYDQELDTTYFEVTKTLTGQILTRATWNSRKEAELHFGELLVEVGASDYNDFQC